MEDNKKNDKKENLIDRRDFLKKMGITAFGAAMGTSRFFKVAEALSFEEANIKLPRHKSPNIKNKIRNGELPDVILPTVAQVKEDLRRASKIRGRTINRITISPDGIDPSKLKKKIREYRAAGIEIENREGVNKSEDLNSVTSIAGPSFGTSSTKDYRSCDDLVVAYSWVYVWNDQYYYYYHDCACQYTPGCTTSRPPEYVASDIHFEEWFYFYSDGQRPSAMTRGLINFAGCNDGCGASSTHIRDWYGRLLSYSDLPIDDPGGWFIWGAHILTTPCPHGDCVTSSPSYPQRVVYRKYTTSP